MVIGRCGVIFDANEIVVEVQFGEGGEDSKLFVEELFGAYCRYAEKLGFSYDILSKNHGHVIGRFVGKNVGKAFDNEPGKHCVQRVPPTESSSRRHTSMIAVAILPIRKDVPALKEKDVEIRTQKGHGKGGQHQNKTESAVRALHRETGLSVFINGREQYSNKREAISVLSAKVFEYRKSNEVAQYNATRKEQLDGKGRSGKVRTYNFVNSRVVDHRTGKKTGRIKDVMRGRFDLVK